MDKNNNDLDNDVKRDGVDEYQPPRDSSMDQVVHNKQTEEQYPINKNQVPYSNDPFYRQNYQSYQPYAAYSTGAPEAPKKRVHMNQDNYSSGHKPKRRSGGLGFIAGILAACLVGGAAGGMIVYNVMSPTLQQFENRLGSLQSELDAAPVISTNTEVNPGTTNNPAPVEGDDMSVEQIADLASPAVVAIGTKALQETIMGYQTIMAAGSGVIVSNDGYIVTNNHVVEGSTETTVTLSSGEEYQATIVGTDPTTDLAVIKINADVELPFLSFGDSSELQVGETVVAIGNPLGEFEGTVTSGVVSGKNRTITIENTTMLNLIQTDAAINSGNSGGALLNLQGEVIGINSAKTSAVGVEGIAFAIPSEVVVPLAEQLIEHGEITRPMLGINGQTVPKNNYGLPQGVMVYDVLEGSSAARAGVQKSDIITAVNGNSVTSVNDINAYKAQMEVGDQMILDIYRDGEELSIEVLLEAPNE